MRKMRIWRKLGGTVALARNSLPAVVDATMQKRMLSGGANSISKPGTRIRYMGNKRALAGEVAALCGTLDSSQPLIDLFGGMCNVAGALASSGRRVEVNDIQSYAELTARCLIATTKGPPERERAEKLLREAFEQNRAALHLRFAKELREEREALNRGHHDELSSLAESWLHCANDANRASEVAKLHENSEAPYRLCSLTFSWGYFGLAQSIDLDSLRFAIDAASKKDLGADWGRWLRLALLQCASRVASTPGHFAQYLRPTSPAAARRIISYRRRSVWQCFMEDLDTLRPFGTSTWRRRNKVHRGEALQVVRTREAPAIYYADPPYSKEHYSRFYHVLETLERYDYPEAHGAGRYRPDRFYSDYARASRVTEACEGLFSAIAQSHGTLLFSYPTSGLLKARRGVEVDGLLREHFSEVRLAIDRPARHSTLGGRHGSASREVREQVWLAR
jgi:adenine-specific DNA-methyltransferase